VAPLVHLLPALGIVLLHFHHLVPARLHPLDLLLLPHTPCNFILTLVPVMSLLILAHLLLLTLLLLLLLIPEIHICKHGLLLLGHKLIRISLVHIDRCLLLVHRIDHARILVVVWILVHDDPPVAHALLVVGPGNVTRAYSRGDCLYRNIRVLNIADCPNGVTKILLAIVVGHLDKLRALHVLHVLAHLLSPGIHAL
jgi:hypothetical protein